MVIPPIPCAAQSPIATVLWDPTPPVPSIPAKVAPIMDMNNPVVPMISPPFPASANSRMAYENVIRPRIVEELKERGIDVDSLPSWKRPPSANAGAAPVGSIPPRAVEPPPSPPPIPIPIPAAVVVDESKPPASFDKAASDVGVSEAPPVPSTVDRPCPSPSTSDNKGGNSGSGDCAVCLEKPIQAAIVPCGHACACLECAKAIQDGASKACPICRGPIVSVLRLHFA